MKKKLLSLALVFVMAVTLLPTAAFAAEELPEPPGAEESTPVSTVPANSPSDDSTVNPPSAADAGAAAAGCTKQSGCPASTHDDACPEACKSATNEGACTANTHKPGCIETCTKETGCPATAAHKTGCLSQNTGTTTPPTTPPATPGAPHTHALTLVEAKDATCTAAGNKAYYTCTCGKYFSDAAGGYEITLAQTVIQAKGHTAPASGFTLVNDTQHEYTCADCGTAGVRQNHSFGSDNKCAACGYERPAVPSPSGTVDISSVYLNTYSISLTWYSNMPEGTGFDIYVDSDRRVADVRPVRSSSGYFSYTVDFSHYLNDSYYTVAVYLHDDHAVYDSTRVYNRYYDHDYDYDYWYPGHYYPNNTPDTNSYGIPYASQVGGRYSAAEAIRILRNSNHNNLQNNLMSSSSALESFERLERAVKSANNVDVSVSTDRSDVPSAIRSGGGVQITGAAFNASRTGSTVRLVVDGPSQSRYAGHGYQFSMTLTGVDNASSLDVPVVVSMPLPSDISAGYVKVLHYHNSNVPTVITPEVYGGRIRFTLTGFSDFVVTDNGTPYGYVSDGYGGYYVPVGNVPRRSLVDEHLAVVLPIIASTPASGYVFSDVSKNHWAASEIAWARDGGIMSGYFDGSFRPYAATTRQELWMVLARLAGAQPADMWAAREWAMSAGITDGTNPYSPLSTQQMIAMLYRYAGYRGMNLAAPTANLALYRDSGSLSPYARTPMSWAINQGIVTGIGDGRLNPQNIATRADFAVYLYRFIR